MRWGKGEMKFSRPVRWLITLLEDKILPVKLSAADPEIISNNISEAHRLHTNKKIVINHAGQYFSSLAKCGINADRDKRFELIHQLF